MFIFAVNVQASNHHEKDAHYKLRKWKRKVEIILVLKLVDFLDMTIRGFCSEAFSTIAEKINRNSQGTFGRLPRKIP